LLGKTFSTYEEPKRLVGKKGQAEEESIGGGGVQEKGHGGGGGHQNPQHERRTTKSPVQEGITTQESTRLKRKSMGKALTARQKVKKKRGGGCAKLVIHGSPGSEQT